MASMFKGSLQRMLINPFGDGPDPAAVENGAHGMWPSVHLSTHPCKPLGRITLDLYRNCSGTVPPLIPAHSPAGALPIEIFRYSEMCRPTRRSERVTGIMETDRLIRTADRTALGIVKRWPTGDGVQRARRFTSLILHHPNGVSAKPCAGKLLVRETVRF